jgi:hypothetical protein
VNFITLATLFCAAHWNRVASFLGFLSILENPKPKMNTKSIKLQISGDADAVNATIALLHALNFINGSLWSHAVRKRGEPSIVRVASRSITIPETL